MQFHRRFSKLLLFVLGFMLYANSISYDFTLDDKLYITQNKFVQAGFGGLQKIWTVDLMEGYTASNVSNLLAGGRFRPVALTIHALEQEVHGNNPVWCHLLNALLYGALGIVVFIFFKKIFSFSKNEIVTFYGAFFAAVLFVIHPLHVEVVANISNRAELLAGLLSLLAALQFIAYLKIEKSKHLVFGFILLLASLFTKESAINIVPVLFLVVVVFKGHFKSSAKSKLILTFGLLITLCLFFFVRYSATSTPVEFTASTNLLNQVYSKATVQEKASGILYCYGLGISKSLLPFNLTHDYYPYHPFVDITQLKAGIPHYPQLSDWQVVLSASLLLLLLCIAAYKFVFNNSFNSNIVVFAIAIFFSTTLLYANIFFGIGAFFNERFLFVASLAPCILLGYVLAILLEHKRWISLSIFGLLSLGYSIITVQRSLDWRTDNHLVLADVQTSSGSARANLLAAEASLNLHKDKPGSNQLLAPRYSNYIEQGIAYAKNALFIYPEYNAPLDILGNLYFEKGQYEQSFDMFIKLFTKKQSDRVWNNLLTINQKVAAYTPSIAEKQIKALEKLPLNTQQRVTLYNKAAQQCASKPNEAISYLEKALLLEPSNVDTYNNLGTALAISGNISKAKNYYLKAYQLGLKSETLLLNLSRTYNQLGKPDSAAFYLNMATN